MKGRCCGPCVKTDRADLENTTRVKSRRVVLLGSGTTDLRPFEINVDDQIVPIQRPEDNALMLVSLAPPTSFSA